MADCVSCVLTLNSKSMLESGNHEKSKDVAIDEAATWFVRMSSHPVTEDTKRSFQLWLQDSPANSDAYDSICKLWGDLKAPAQIVARSSGPKFGRVEYFVSYPVLKWTAVATSAVLFIGLGAIWRDEGLIARGFADYATSPGTHREVALSDGTKIYLDGNSAMDTTFLADERHIKLIRGRAWFNVARDENRPFYVETQNATVRVLGTIFTVDIEKSDKTTVSVESGEVSVHSADSQIELEAGNVATASPGGLHKLENAEIDRMSSWRRGLIIMNQTPLETVLSEVSRYTTGRIVVSGQNIKNLQLSGVFRTDDTDAIFAALQSVLGLKVRKIPGLLTFIYR
ncbi:transmembrane sensor [Ochrobactrum sp. P6BSIII]|uniref:FecR domain-containing protein n=1 Tax=unclassified Ochrobactrum TaxID=239106 RepID=UPI0009928E25|nr:transmembrane sensor [Ochrobactrum sp. P6BSIII]